MAENQTQLAKQTPSTAIQFFQPNTVLWCCEKYPMGISNSSHQIIHLFENLNDLTPLQKNTLIARYVSIVENLRFRARLYTIMFHIGRSVVTIGSLIVPALLSIQHTGSNADHINLIIFWITWATSLFVTTSNGIMTLFKVDKKYFFLHTSLEQLKSEAYQFINLSGKYGGFYTKGKILPDHSNQYIFFTNNLERIKLKQVEEEYYKLIDNYSGHTTDHATITDLSGNKQHLDKITAPFYQPTPDLEKFILENPEKASQIRGPPKNVIIVDGPQEPSSQKKKINTERRQ
jgi:hypothetical protein